MAQGSNLTVKCAGRCLISLMNTSHMAPGSVSRLSDHQCYSNKHIQQWIISRARKGYTLYHEKFVLPTKAPITQQDLDILHIDITKIERESDYVRLDQLPGTPYPRPSWLPEDIYASHFHTVNSFDRWQLALHAPHSTIDLPIWMIEVIDTYILWGGPAHGPTGLNMSFDHNIDDNIKIRANQTRIVELMEPKNNKYILQLLRDIGNEDDQRDAYNYLVQQSR